MTPMTPAKGNPIERHISWRVYVRGVAYVGVGTMAFAWLHPRAPTLAALVVLPATLGLAYYMEKQYPGDY